MLGKKKAGYWMPTTSKFHSRRFVLGVLVAMPLFPRGVGAAPTGAAQRQAIQGRDPRLGLWLVEWAASLHPSVTTVRALAELGGVEAAKQAAKRADPTSIVPCLLAIADTAPALTPAERLELVRRGLQLARANGSSRDLMASTLALSRFGTESDARHAMQMVLDSPSFVAWHVADVISEPEAPVTEWMLVELASRLPKAVDPYGKAFAYLGLASAYGRMGRRDQLVSHLQQAVIAADEVASGSKRRIVRSAIASKAVAHGELEIAKGLVPIGELAPALALHYARNGQRVKALDMLSRSPPGGLYVAPKAAAAQTIVEEAIENGRMADADHYIDAFSAELSGARLPLLARLVLQQAELGPSVASRRARQLAELVDNLPPSMTSSRSDVETMLVVASALTKSGMQVDANEALAYAANLLKYLSYRSTAEQAHATAMVVKEMSLRKRHKEATQYALRMVDLLQAAPEAKFTERSDKAEALLSAEAAARVLSR